MKDWNNDPHEPGLDDSDPVWRLLAESPRPKPDAWFAVRTMARCRNAELNTEFPGIRGIWRWALGGGLGVCLAVFLLAPHHHSQSATMSDQQKNVQEAFAIIASMNTPDSSSSSSTPTTTWQDSSL